MKMLPWPRMPPLQTCHIRWGMKYHLGGRKVNQTTRGREGVWSAPDHLSTAYLVFRAERTAKPSVTFSNNSPSVFVSAGGLGLRSARGEICRERLFRGVNCGKQLERLSWRVCFFFPLHVKRKVPTRPRRHKRGTSAY